MTDKEKLVQLINQGVEIYSDCYQRKLTAASAIADHLIAHGVVILPCNEGDAVYKIVKFCEENTGYKEFYRPSKEFAENCPHLEPAEWECSERCKACDDYYDASYCSLYLKIFCDTCKERIAIQRDKFTFAMMRRVFNTPMFDKSTELRDTLFLTKEEAERALNYLLVMPQPPEGE